MEEFSENLMEDMTLQFGKLESANQKDVPSVQVADIGVEAFGYG
tara:strand:+ start:908 stop:1039 length:132 start_codon:yes stop_codon:yes gene_type:complete